MMYRNTKTGELKTLRGLGPSEMDAELTADAFVTLLEFMQDRGIISATDAINLVPGGWRYEPVEQEVYPS